jgi:hypothetical protein
MCGKVKFLPLFSALTLSGSAYALAGLRRFHACPAVRWGTRRAFTSRIQDGSVSA